MTEKKTAHSAVLLVAFGSSLPHTRALYENLMQLTGRRYPDCDVFLAYSSRMVLARLEREGRPAPDVRGEVEKIAAAGYTDLHVLPLFTIAGEDFNKWTSLIADLSDRFDCYTLGFPLLHSSERVKQVARLLLRTFSERDSDELIVFMGHGSPHAEGIRFAEMDQALGQLDPNALLGCVEGDPDFRTVLERVGLRSEKRIVLAPFMMVTGDHAMNDMAGPDDDSWKSQLEQAGYSVRVMQRGLLEIPDIVDLLLGVPL